MFKKLKDKLAEEVKSSPQRIQQFAQAAQAAVTSASSSISDITNSDLFSIGDNNESQSSLPSKPLASTSNNTLTFQEVSLLQADGAQTGTNSMDFLSNHEIMENPRQRRLSNSSFASDISFRLPSYESPSMYHLQSDMEVSASEAEERGFSSGALSLDRVTKEQLYAAYRRTQERYTKYRTQYADLARHYKLLERENAKARSVLVETQDKALRRISELREQCTLEQSAKAHLEKALRVEIEERNMKIETLNTKISFLQNDCDNHSKNEEESIQSKSLIHSQKDTDVQLINLSVDNEEIKQNKTEGSLNDTANLNSKIEKMEQLLNKYKESLKTSKEKNSQLTVELQKISSELENKVKEIESLKLTEQHFDKAKQKIEELNSLNEELQNKVNTYDFNKTKEMSTLEMDLRKSQEEITQLRSKIDVFSKREEEYAISLAENKLSIHKELESKEAEIKSLKDNLSSTKKELQSLNIVLDDYKLNVTALEEERSKLNNEINELNAKKTQISELDLQINILTQKCQTAEQLKSITDEEMQCLQLQMKQETAEKLAMIDRNLYLENRNTQLIEENTKKSSQITQLQNEIGSLNRDNVSTLDESTQKQLLDEIEFWKGKFNKLETEIQDERVELVKLQSEIEKLLSNHEQIQRQNSELHDIVTKMESENTLLQEKQFKTQQNKSIYEKIAIDVKALQKSISLISQDTKAFKQEINDAMFNDLKKNIEVLSNINSSYEIMKDKYEKLEVDYKTIQNEEKSIKDQLHRTSEELNILKDKSQISIAQTQMQTSANLLLQEEVKNLLNKYNIATEEINVVKNEKQILITKMEELENKYQHLQTEIDHENNQYLVALDQLKLLQDEKQSLMKKISKIEKENDLINNEVEKLKIKHKEDISQINALNSEKQQLLVQVQEKEHHIQKLNQPLKTLSEENSSLKNQCESIANSVKLLESEINEVRKSHSDIEIEKDRLSSIIETLEKKEFDRKLTSIDKDIQTDKPTEINESTISNEDTKDDANDNDQIVLLLNEIDLLNVKNSKYEDEIKSLKDTQVQLSNKMTKLNEDTVKNINENTDKYQSLQNDNDLLKEENRRLHSDIEGLQTYLAKISKENGVLNDKLRELIASSENTNRSDYQSNELLDLQNEVVADKEKIEDLTRENNLLLEENLELKDQLQLQNYAETKKSTNNNESDAITTDKYTNLLGTKNKLEEKLMSLEQMNKSISGNMQQMQGNNEKLRLTNEKLERRLDEALVSLRHLHSLQENTELEYLRNILYEYLTGSGTHSITLAKVLAAVVKFDDKQTQQVLLKEKERQGLLRQLGLI